MATKHDQLMKELLASFPDQFLRLAVPRIAGAIDLDAVDLAPEEHYPGSPTGRERRADLVGLATALPEREGAGEGEIEEVMLHTEIELRYRGLTAPRLLSYHRGLSLKYAMVVHTIVLGCGAVRQGHSLKSTKSGLWARRWWSFATTASGCRERRRLSTWHGRSRWPGRWRR